MANAQPEEHEYFPRTGRVNEMCREWVVREDGALAHHLQSQEINEHLQGNRFRNALVREDFPHALDEQLREQQLAEQAAAVYHQMLAEQEEIDTMYAQKLADNLEREERSRRRVLESHDDMFVRQLLDVSRSPTSRIHQSEEITTASKTYRYFQKSQVFLKRFF
ncbi:coiled-coil domain-containing protein 50-like [Photinus pyralis]|uniref:coiled-coil domain-containing protein 50-like n=1 Tax=Photinus pyralis TaxID=7054 RepID=UPI001266EE26|nr:coiled-coil domain-containing protein 50-like [Photinus pyralis]